MNDGPHRDLALFTEALELPAAERAAFLNRASAGDEGLRRKVEALLRAHERTGDFLEHAPTGPAVEALRGLPVGEKPGDHVGRYKLLQQIGEGGCGVVFMAEQQEPVRRRVALKILKPGLETKSVIARFEAERQALALMDHPNIAKIFDAGATPSGRPYFVMELIRGLKITDYCDQNSLTTEQRLELFAQVCQAVQHAHQKGVIHRDIKPSNILVTTSLEGVDLPVVIDFGIAKAATNQRLTDKTLFTAFEMLIGTPAYMSPEQAALTSVDVDTRTDIYSLGVLLYELLAGSTPFDTAELLQAGLDEIRRIIREQEPVRPSTRLSKLAGADLTTVAQRRKSEPPRLIRAVSGDLDWIVMKALEKDRTRRYPTANGMAMDIRRYLDGEVVLARPPSSLYRFQKLFLRHKLLISGLSVFFLLLVMLVGFLGALVARERELRQKSDLLAADTLADAYIRDGKPEQAEPLFLQGLEIRRKQTPGYLPTAQSLWNLMWAFLIQSKFDEAVALLDKLLTPAEASRPEYVDLLALRAEVLARAGRWGRAQADAERLRDLRPEDYGSYHRLAPLLVANKDFDGYQRLCQQIAARFHLAVHPIVADQLAKDCLILPSSGVDLHRVATLAEFAVANGAREPAYPFFLGCKALAEYRLGHFEKAVEWAEHAARNPFPYSQSEAFAILAMAQFKINQTNAARASLARCEQVVQTKLATLGRGDLSGDWRDWIIAHTLLNEAKNLLGAHYSNADLPDSGGK